MRILLSDGTHEVDVRVDGNDVEANAIAETAARRLLEALGQGHLRTPRKLELRLECTTVGADHEPMPGPTDDAAIIDRVLNLPEKPDSVFGDAWHDEYLLGYSAGIRQARRTILSAQGKQWAARAADRNT